MIELNTTWNTVVMLLVAGGVGLIGGIGAALIEWKTKQAGEAPPTPVALAAQAAESAVPVPPTPPSSKFGTGFLNVFSCIVLGGIAAVAILYFFPPIKEVVTSGEGGESVTTTSYELIKLVTLSLIVGSAGTTFLQALQARALNSVNEQRAETAEAKTGAAVNLAGRAPEAAATSIAAAQPQVEKALQDAGLSPAKVSDAAKAVMSEASSAATEGVQAQLQAVQVIAAAGPSGADNA